MTITGTPGDYIYENDLPAGLVIVPNYVRDAINAKLDAAIAEEPEAAKERDQLYNTILAYFSEYGSLPEFTLKKRV